MNHDPMEQVRLSMLIKKLKFTLKQAAELERMGMFDRTNPKHQQFYDDFRNIERNIALLQARFDERNEGLDS